MIRKGVLVLQYLPTLGTLKRRRLKVQGFDMSPPIAFVQEVLATDQTAPT